MGRAPKMKFYAVRTGRQGPQIYTSWEEAKKNVSKFPGAVHKSFTDRTKAEEWLLTTTPLNDRFPISISPRPNLVLPKTPSPRDLPPHLPTDPPETAVIPELTALTSLQAPNIPSPQEDAPILLSPEQEEVLRMVQRGQSVFFTGSAGTGKSVLLRKIIECCGGRSSPYLAITASTGIASVNIGGSTLHSWAGIGLGQETAEKLFYRIIGQDKAYRKRRKEEGYDTDEDLDDYSDGKGSRALQRWLRVKVLIIDEISMIDGKLFDKLEEVARRIRRHQKHLPFGGIQLVLSGDFCQLPPVGDRDKNGAPVPVTLAFDSQSWSSCVGRPIVLKKVFRQKDQAFVDMLNSMRYGNLESDVVTRFKALQRPVKYEDGLEPTELFPRKDEVRMANASRLAKLQGQAHTYNALDIPGRDENGNTISGQQMDRLLDRLIAPKDITLKVDAQVMLIKNLVQGHLVNGSIGSVIGFCTTQEARNAGIETAEAARSQGAPASSQNNKQKDITGLWPIVRFTNGQVLLCVPQSFEVNNAEGEMEARREQVPLILAWALSIHKSQGQTLQRVRVNMRNIFEKGQAYVALSRATSMNSLEILNFNPAKVMAHPRVLEWLRKETTPPVVNRSGAYEVDVDADLDFWEEV